MKRSPVKTRKEDERLGSVGERLASVWSWCSFSNILIAVALYYLYLILTSFYGLFIPTPCPSATHPKPCVTAVLAAGDKVDIYAYFQLGEVRYGEIQWRMHEEHQQHLFWEAKGVSTLEDYATNVSVAEALRKVDWAPHKGRALSVHVLMVPAGGDPKRPIAVDAAQLTQWMPVAAANKSNLLTGDSADSGGDWGAQNLVDHTFWSGKLGIVIQKGPSGRGGLVGKVTGSRVPQSLQGLAVVTLQGRGEEAKSVENEPLEVITSHIKAASRPLKMTFQRPATPKAIAAASEWHLMPRLNLLLSTDTTSHSIIRRVTHSNPNLTPI